MIEDLKLIRITDLADQVGMERGRAARILRSAGLRRDKHRRWPSEEALEALRPHIDVAQQAAQHATGLGFHGTTGSLGDYAAARAVSEAARAEKLRQDIDIRAGRLIERQAVVQAGEEFAVEIRTSILAIPAKVAARLVGKTKEEIAAALDIELRHALTDLADVDNYILGRAA